MTIEHDPQKHKFYVTLGQEEARLEYAMRGPGVVAFEHVFVPTSARGQGLAGRLCIKAFEYAKEQGLKVIPACPFVSGEFLPRFPQYQELVAQ